MYPHRIRLRGPWERESLGATAAAPRRVRFQRRFGYPGRIDAYERVWLTVAGAADGTAVTLNGESLGSHAPFEFEVTSLLRERNELLVEVAGPAEDGASWGEVALEIRCTAYLRDVRFRVERTAEGPRLAATGEVVGAADGLLELYLLLDRSTVAYATTPAEAAGRRFELVSDVLRPPPATPVPVKLDLVRGASVWYTIEQLLTTDG